MVKRDVRVLTDCVHEEPNADEPGPESLVAVVHCRLDDLFLLDEGFDGAQDGGLEAEVDVCERREVRPHACAGKSQLESL